MATASTSKEDSDELEALLTVLVSTSEVETVAELDDTAAESVVLA